MVHEIKINELYQFSLSIRIFTISIRGFDGSKHKFLMQGGESKAKAYAKELEKIYDGTSKVKEISIQ